MKSIISLGLAVGLLVACGGAHAGAPKPARTDTPASFTGTWSVATVLYRDSSPDAFLQGKRERLFHKNVSVGKDAATLLDRTCSSSSLTVKVEDADAEAKRRHVSRNDLGVVMKNDQLLVGTLRCKSDKGETEERLYRRVRNGKLDGALVMLTPDFTLGLDPG